MDFSAFKPQEVDEINRFVQKNLGLFYAEERLNDLIRGFLQACNKLERSTPLQCMDLIREPVYQQKIIFLLSRYLTIRETYFFRDRELFSYLQNNYLPSLISRKLQTQKIIRIWSAACSTGEEPYSLAILLSHLIPDINSWKIEIYATDINPDVLEIAREGIYPKWSFREQSQLLSEPYIIRLNDTKCRISEKINSMVTFRRLNLMDDRYPEFLKMNSMDIIFCRNVLMYFSDTSVEKVTRNIFEILCKDGIFFVSPQEIGQITYPEFSMEHQGRVFFFYKLKKNNNHPYEHIIPLIKQIEDFSITGRIEENSFDINNSEDIISNYSIQTISTDTSDILIPEPERKSEITDSLTRDFSLSLNNSDKIEETIKYYADNGDYDRALGYLDKITSENPLNPLLYQMRSIILQESGDISGAILAAKQSLFVDPDFIPAHMALGSLLNGIGKKKESQRHYNLALEILNNIPDDIIITGTDGLSAFRLKELIISILKG